MSTNRSVTIVTQTCVRSECTDAFARWQDETSAIVAKLPGFIEQKVTPPSPPTQVDWVILQRFDSLEIAQRWLHSPEHQKRIAIAEPMLIGRDDVHIVQDDAGVRPAPVSAVISTRVRPGMEFAYRTWERRIAAEQTKARGFQGYRFEPPVPGVQDDFLAILSFDTEADLQAWLDSPVRKQLVEEASPMTEEFHTRIARTGFDQWFPQSSSRGPRPAAWKMNMIVLLTLYPIVCLFSHFVQKPLLVDRADLPLAVGFFLGNIVSVLLTSILVPWASKHLDWWLQPTGPHASRNTLVGTALVAALYAVSVAVFLRLL
jgi:uncharacterized protein